MSEIIDLGRRLREGSAGCEAIVRMAFEGVRCLEPELNAFITVTEESALLVARERDRELRSGKDRGPLHGIPIVLKDCIDTAGVRTTMGAHIFRDRVPHRDAEIVRRLSHAGAVMLGKNNMNELAAGGPGGYNKFYGSTRNPWNVRHESGGSSSGTGAVVAAGICPCGIGTDTGGSIRGPASHMGVVGLRPTLGRFDMSGIFPRAPSLDTVGPLAASALDAAVVFNVLAGNEPPVSTDVVPVSLSRLCVALVDNHSLEQLEREVHSAVQVALKVFATLGARVRHVRVPELADERTLDAASQVLVYEFARDFGPTYSNKPNRDDFGPVVHQDFEKARGVSVPDYESAIRLKQVVSTRVAAAFEQVDALITPTMARTAPPASEPDLSGTHRRFTIPVSFAGLPAISVPCGVDTRGLPIGLQIIGAPFSEAKILAIAHAYESATRASRQRPALHFDIARAL